MSLEVKNILSHRVLLIEQRENSRVYTLQTAEDREVVFRKIRAIDKRAEIYQTGTRSILAFKDEYYAIREIANQEIEGTK